MIAQFTVGFGIVQMELNEWFFFFEKADLFTVVTTIELIAHG